MLYLEDYIELVEILPQELRDRFTEMRLLDLQSQNSLDQLQSKVNNFYIKASNMSSDQRQKEYEILLQEYNKPLIDSEEKINLATQIQDFLNKYTRKLEQDIQKFKLELEADNSGITEILEKRVTDSQQKENRTNIIAARNKIIMRNLRSEVGIGGNNSLSQDKIKIENRSIGNNSIGNNSNEYKYNIGQNYNSTGNNSMNSSSGNNSINYSLSNIGAGGMAITAAASQAIAATQQMKQGRRTASLKASYEAIHGAGTSTADMNISKELAGAAQTAIAAIQDTHKKSKKKNSSNLSMGTINMNTSSALHSLMMETTSTNNKQIQHNTSSSSSNLNTSTHAHNTSSSTHAHNTSTSTHAQQDSNINDEEDLDLGYEPSPDEPRYCQCNQVAFGVMVACDNKSCPYEWYHCECVGIASDNPPKGKWYCPLCIEKLSQKTSSNTSLSSAHHYNGGSSSSSHSSTNRKPSSHNYNGSGSSSSSGGPTSRKQRKTS